MFKFGLNIKNYYNSIILRVNIKIGTQINLPKNLCKRFKLIKINKKITFEKHQSLYIK